MSADEGDIIFTGGSAEEAEDFIFAVKKRAYLKGKHEDNKWIVDFVSVCFAKKALRWYERLDEETKKDWNLLKRAILDEYEEDSIPSSLVPTSAPISQSSVLGKIPAAASPVRSGRIRVESESSDLRGYISSTFHNTDWCIVSPDQNNAAIFDFEVPARTIKLQGGNDDDYLIARAHGNDWDFRKGSSHYGAMMKNRGHTACTKAGWSNSIQIDQWSVNDEGKLTARWTMETGDFWELEASGHKSGKYVYLTPDCQGFINSYGLNYYNALTLYFDPVS